MSEGKLKNQIDVLVEPYEQVYFNEVDENPFTKDDVFDILDEAKADFPLMKTKCVGDWGEYNEEYYDVDEIDIWKKKWFGNGETK